MRGNGGVIGTLQPSTTTAAYGMWGINDVADRIGTNWADLAKTWPALKDPSFSSVVLLCHFDEYASVSTYKDKSTSGFDLIQQAGATGNVLGGLSTTQNKFAATSLSVGGNGRGVSHSSFTALGTGDMTLEMWFYQTSQAATNTLLDLSNNDTSGNFPVININTSGKILYFHNPTTAANITGGTTVSLNAWHHLAITRVSGTTYAGLDGAQEGADYTDANSYASGKVWVGQTAIATQGLAGFIAELRLTAGVGRYARTYTVPTTRFPDY